MSKDDPSNNTPTPGDPELGDAGKRAIAAERARADAAERNVSALQAQLKTFTDAGITDPASTKTELDRLTAENTTLTTDNDGKTKEITRLNVGIDKGLPKSLIARLQGDDEDSLTADAEALLEFVPADNKPTVPKSDPSQGPKAAGAPTVAQQFADAIGDF
jgi:hypothetical protein